MRLKQYVFPALVALVLCAAVVVVWPAPAQAQTPSTHGGRAAKAIPAHVVVRPGDCLWSISQRLLPADATPQQIYYEVARIYALNRDQIGEDPNLIYAGQVLLVEPAPRKVEVVSVEPAPNPAAASASKPVAASAPKPVAEPEPKKVEVVSVEPAPKPVAAPSRETAQRSSREVSRSAARELSGTPTHQSLPQLAHAPILKPVAKLSPKTASDEERTLTRSRLLVAAVVGAGIGGATMCLIFAVALLVARRLSTKRTTRQEHEKWEMSAENRRNGWHQQRPEAAPPAPDPPLRTPPPKPKTGATKGGGSQW